ncbi:hypothetical protein AKJ09_03655 [Labilithrix luteola]|uniref:Mannosyl-glycoprotein endo-beta-N-acetylglucosamidase-like domain-containing protein n=1 Tax=Labilithrix luteola TaxID=1391654 RepID=A0A0K1PUE3_9BACT|nr:glucosaminidase domain-containing protein [Labilithrix luteola]AKU96991.1 hypothetical protein AKJ09_03655 [Labilithrix luteola]
MDERQVPIKRTPFTTRDYARAVITAWRRLLATMPTKAAVGCLWAQYALETGRGAACWNNNIGNVKHAAGDGFNYIMLPNTWEVVNGVRVTFQPPHPATWFRAFDTLESAMTEHLRLLKEKRYASSWPAIEAGDPDGFARALKAKGYYTAPVEDYAKGLRTFHAEFMRSNAYDDAVEDVLAASEVPTEPELPIPPSEPTVVVRPKVPLGRPSLDE